MVTKTNKIFNEWILGEGNQVWVFVFDKAINTVGSIIFLGNSEKFEAVRVTATAAIVTAENAVNKIVIKILNHIDRMAPGNLRKQSVGVVRNMLEGTFAPSKIIKIGFKLVQK